MSVNELRLKRKSGSANLLGNQVGLRSEEGTMWRFFEDEGGGQY